jgi:hypothetical protein
MPGACVIAPSSECAMTRSHRRWFAKLKSHWTFDLKVEVFYQRSTETEMTYFAPSSLSVEYQREVRLRSSSRKPSSNSSSFFRSFILIGSDGFKDDTGAVIQIGSKHFQ